MTSYAGADVSRWREYVTARFSDLDARVRGLEGIDRRLTFRLTVVAIVVEVVSRFFFGG